MGQPVNTEELGSKSATLTHITKSTTQLNIIDASISREARNEIQRDIRSESRCIGRALGEVSIAYAHIISGSNWCY